MEELNCIDCYFHETCTVKGQVEPSRPGNEGDLSGCLAYTTYDEMRTAEYAGSHNTFFNHGNPNRW